MRGMAHLLKGNEMRNFFKGPTMQWDLFSSYVALKRLQFQVTNILNIHFFLKGWKLRKCDVNSMKKKFMFFWSYVKFRFSEKATKFEKISHLFWLYWVITAFLSKWVENIFWRSYLKFRFSEKATKNLKESPTCFDVQKQVVDFYKFCDFLTISLLW